MSASLRDVRVVSPAVNLPGLQLTAVLDATREALKPVGPGVDDIGLFKVNKAFAGVPLIAQGESSIPDDNLNVNGAHRHQAPALLDRRGCSPACPARWSAHRRATARRPSAAPPVPPSSNSSREHLSWTPASSRAARRRTATTTSSTPRGIYLHTLTMVADLGMRSRDAVMLVTPMFHGQCWGLPQAAVRAAAKVVLPGRYMAHDTKVLVDAMIAEGVTVANGAPAIFLPMLDYIRSLEVKPDLSRARLLSGATEPPLSLMRGLYEATGADVIHVYGATETTPLVAINYGIKSTLDGKLTREELWDRKRYQGLMVSGVDYRLVDAAGNDLPFDGVSQGEVLLRGPWIIESYAKLADGTDRFLDGYWRSGDVGAIDKHGYLKITDRIKDVIKSGGEWISSIDMENAITSHPRIREAAVIGVEHPTWQERPVVIAVTDDGTEFPLAEIHALLPAFAKWQLPDTVVYVDAIPRTSVGKIDKKALRAAHADTYRATA